MMCIHKDVSSWKAGLSLSISRLIPGITTSVNFSSQKFSTTSRVGYHHPHSYMFTLCERLITYHLKGSLTSADLMKTTERWEGKR